jgi:hypothetical protein
VRVPDGEVVEATDGRGLLGDRKVDLAVDRIEGAAVNHADPDAPVAFRASGQGHGRVILART